MRLSIAVLSAAALAAASGRGFAATYDIDPAHSNIGFKVRHLMISKVNGRFGKFEGTFDHDAKDPKVWSASVTIDAASIDTGIGKRDDHLRNEDFFDVAKHPSIVFRSTKALKKKDGTFLLKGELTLRGVTKPVTLDVEPGGSMMDGRGREHVGFSAKGKINRKDFGVAYNQPLASGGLSIGEEVELLIDVEGTPK